MDKRPPLKNSGNKPGDSGKYTEDISRCLEALKSGGIILYPTDTVWSLGCDATNSDAVKKLYDLKKRDQSNPMLLLVEHADRVGRYVKQIPDIAIQLIEVNDKPMTIVYPGGVNVAPSLLAADGSVGIRITNDVFCKKLIAAFNKPIVSTSANFNGEPAPENFRDIEPEVVGLAGYVVKWRQNDPAAGKESSVLKVGLRGEIEIIRQ